MVEANGIEFWTEPFGDPAHPPILLIMGIDASFLWWEESFCRMLTDSGRFVIRYDHPRHRPLDHLSARPPGLHRRRPHRRRRGRPRCLRDRARPRSRPLDCSSRNSVVKRVFASDDRKGTDERVSAHAHLSGCRSRCRPCCRSPESSISAGSRSKWRAAAGYGTRASCP
jgi:hypothetical protein